MSYRKCRISAFKNKNAGYESVPNLETKLRSKVTKFFKKFLFFRYGTVPGIYFSAGLSELVAPLRVFGILRDAWPRNQTADVTIMRIQLTQPQRI